jgi:hypothetical protein
VVRGRGGPAREERATRLVDRLCRSLSVLSQLSEQCVEARGDEAPNMKCVMTDKRGLGTLGHPTNGTARRRPTTRDLRRRQIRARECPWHVADGTRGTAGVEESADCPDSFRLRDGVYDA